MKTSREETAFLAKHLNPVITRRVK